MTRKERFLEAGKDEKAQPGHQSGNSFSLQLISCLRVPLSLHILPIRGLVGNLTIGRLRQGHVMLILFFCGR